MPQETIEAFQDHGEVRGLTVEEDVDGAQATLDALGEAGVDYDDVTQTLEREGVEKFADSFSELLSKVGGKRDSLAGASA
jgi:transaldolase